jgi:hypothetical protein
MLPVGLIVLACVGCSSSSSSSSTGTVITGNSSSSGSTSGGGGYDITRLDQAMAGQGQDLAAAMAPDGRIGVAYFGVINDTARQVAYLEVATDNSQTVTILDTVQRAYGISVAFDPAGNPAVTYLAYDPATPPDQAPDGGVFWTQRHVGLATIKNGVATHSYPVHHGDEAMCLPAASFSNQNPEVVGLYPAIAFKGAETVILYRDVHGGQFPQDYAKSDLEDVHGSVGNWVHDPVICGSDNVPLLNAQGMGVYTKIASGAKGLGMVTSGQSDLGGTAQKIWFARQTPTATQWSNQTRLVDSALVGDTGPTLAVDPQGIFGVAWVDRLHDILSFKESPDGVTFGLTEQVFGSGTGGWEPSVAFDPTQSDTPAIVYYVCSGESSAVVCPPDQDELQVSTRRGTHWDPETVDPEGGGHPQLLFTQDGRKVVVYRDLTTGGLKLARQRAN